MKKMQPLNKNKKILIPLALVLFIIISTLSYAMTKAAFTKNENIFLFNYNKTIEFIWGKENISATRDDNKKLTKVNHEITLPEHKIDINMEIRKGASQHIVKTYPINIEFFLDNTKILYANGFISKNGDYRLISQSKPINTSTFTAEPINIEILKYSEGFKDIKISTEYINMPTHHITINGLTVNIFQEPDDKTVNFYANQVTTKKSVIDELTINIKNGEIDYKSKNNIGDDSEIEDFIDSVIFDLYVVATDF